MTRHFGKLEWIFDGNQPGEYGCIYQSDQVKLIVNRKQLRNGLCISSGMTGVSFLKEVEAQKDSKLIYRVYDVCSLEDEEDPEILKRCFRSSDPVLWFPVIDKYLSNLSDGELRLAVVYKWPDIVDPCDKQRLIEALQPRWSAVETIFRKIASPKNRSQNTNIQKAQPGVKKPQKKWTMQERWDLCCQMLDQGSSSQEIRSYIHRMSKGDQQEFWKILDNAQSLYSPMFKVAPVDMQQAIIRREFDRLFKIQVKVSIEPHFDAALIFRNMNKDDHRLAEMWVCDDITDSDVRASVYAQMLSARAAEKTVVRLYHQMLHFTEDISIGQVAKRNLDYVDCDILIDHKIPLDVKNTRSRWGPNAERKSTTYVEHIVPRFKHDRNLERVIIVGVFSPREKLETILHNHDEVCGEITVLGETDLKTISELENRFEDEILTIKIKNELWAKPRSARWSWVLPVWIFNYPERFREKLRKSIDNNPLLSLADGKILVPEMIKQIREELPLAAMLTVGRELPSHWKVEIPTWQQDLYFELLSCRRECSLPALFLTILHHFARALISTPPAYQPSIYGRMLLLEPPKVWAETVHPDISAGLYDPLQVIRGLCTNLETVWRKREQLQLRQFQRFRYRGLGYLHGYSNAKEKWISLMAYCGGDFNHQGKSGKCGTKLILGDPEVKVCDNCDFLICPKCGFCSRRCSTLDNSWR